MAGDRTIRIKVDGDSSGLANAARRAGGDVDGMDKRLGSLGRTATIGAAAFAGMAAVWIGSTARVLAGMERLRAQTDTVINSMGVAWTNTDHVVGYAEKIEKLSGIEMENVQAGQNLLLTYANIQNRMGAGNDIFDQATSLMADMSQATGKDMPASATLMGKALNDPIKGVAALTKVGVQFTAQQKEQIAAFVESGNVMGAQKVILAELTRQFGGSAAAFGETTAGQVAKLQNQFGDLSEELLVGVLPAINGLVDLGAGLVQWLTDNQGLVKTLAIAFGGLATTLLVVRGSIAAVNGVSAAFQAISGVMKGNVAGLGGAFAGMSTAARVASISMGAIGIVATIIGVALSAFGGQSEEAAARQQELAEAGRAVADAITAQNGAINQSVKSTTAKQLGDAKLLEVGKQLGISGGTLVNAVLDEGKAYDSVTGKLEKEIKTRQARIDMLAQQEGGNIKERDAIQSEVDARQTLLDGLNEMHGAKQQTLEEEKASAEAAGLTTEEYRKQTGAVQEQVTALDELIDRMSEAAGIQTTQIEAEGNWYAALEDANEAIVKNGETLDQHTQKGRDNMAALLGIKDRAYELISADAALGATQEQTTAKMQAARDAFIQAATQMGIDEIAAGALADQLGLIPGNYQANIVADTGPARAAVSELDKWIHQVLDPGYNANVTAGVPLPGIGKATGGPVVAGRSYLVGERGPEILSMAGAGVGGNITPNHQLGGSGDVTVNVMIDGQQFTGMVRKEINSKNRSTRRAATSGTGGAR